MDYGATVNLSRYEYWFSPSAKNKKIYKFSRTLYIINTHALLIISKILIKITLKLSTKVLIAGDDLNEYYNRCNLKNSKRVYYNVPVDTDKFSPKAYDNEFIENLTKGKEFSILIGHAGRLAAEKGLDTLIEAVNEISSDLRKNKCLLLIAGDGDLREFLENKINEYRLTDIVILCGNIKRELMPKFLASLDIFLYTATQGGTTSAGVLEAMSSECAVIATDSPVRHRQLLNNCGICIKTRSKRELKQALLKIINDENLRTKFKYSARKKVIEEYSFNLLKTKLLRVIE